MRSGIYAIVNKINGKIYVGRTSNFQQRRLAHAKSMNQGTSPMSLDLATYGADAFDFVVIERCSGSMTMRDREAFWISRFKDEKLYNSVRYKYREAKETTA